MRKYRLNEGEFFRRLETPVSGEQANLRNSSASSSHWQTGRKRFIAHSQNFRL